MLHPRCGQCQCQAWAQLSLHFDSNTGGLSHCQHTRTECWWSAKAREEVRTGLLCSLPCSLCISSCCWAGTWLEVAAAAWRNFAAVLGCSQRWACGVQFVSSTVRPFPDLCVLANYPCLVVSHCQSKEKMWGKDMLENLTLRLCLAGWVLLRNV